MGVRAGLTVLACAIAGGCAMPEWHDTPPELPEPIAPETGANLVVNAPVRFAWRPVERATHYDFHVFDRETRDITRYYRDELDAASVCTAEACSLTLSIALPYVDGHAWRVRSGNNAGKSGWTRSTFSMVNGAGVGPIGSRSPATPEPLEPAGGTLVRDAVATFAWTPSEGATAYDFHLFDRRSGTVVGEVRDLPAATVCQEPGRCVLARTVALPDGESHAWRVRASNRHGRSSWTRVEFAVASP